MRIVCIIPARGGSKEIPNKNIMNFHGIPLIAWSIKQAKDSVIDDVYVSSDSSNILTISKILGAKTILRPDELAQDDSTSEDALKHAIKHLKLQYEDIVVFLQATSPVRLQSDIDNAIDVFLREKADSLFSAGVLKEWCVWKKVQNELVSYSFDYTNRGFRKDREAYYLDNGSIYIFKVATLFDYNNRLGGKISIYEMPLWRSFEIDDKESLELCKMSMTKLLMENNYYENTTNISK